MRRTLRMRLTPGMRSKLGMLAARGGARRERLGGGKKGGNNDRINANLRKLRTKPPDSSRAGRRLNDGGVEVPCRLLSGRRGSGP